MSPKLMLWWSLVLMIAASLLGAPLGAPPANPLPQDQKEQEKIQEFVRVVNIEVITRVMEKGKPVGGLKKGDFTILENGQPREINGFFEVHRRFAKPKVEAAQAAEVKQPGRLFLLFFWIHEPNVDFGKALEAFFRDIYQENDRVILANVEKTYEIASPADKEKVVEQFNRDLTEYTRRVQSERTQTAQQLQHIFEEYRYFMENVNPNRSIEMPITARRNLVNKYSQMLKEFRLQRLTPHLSRLEDLARSLELIQADKWALLFYQRDSLPVFDMKRIRQYGAQIGLREDDLSMLETEFNRVQFEVDFVKESAQLTEFLRTRFIQANALFHLMLIDSKTPAYSDTVEVSQALTVNATPYSNWEAVFRDVTHVTGGQVMDGNNLAKALVEAANCDDIYYVLTYPPTEDGKRERRLDIRVNRAQADVIHGRRLEMEKLPEVRIKNATFDNGILNLELEDFYRLPRSGMPSGYVSVTVIGQRAKEGVPEVWLEKETETTGELALRLVPPKPGDYLLTVRVLDHLTGRQTIAEVNASAQEIAPPVAGEMPASPELAAILHKTALYCEKLKRAAFHYICQEEVAEDILSRPAGADKLQVHTERTSWLYDYQIVYLDGKITESRTLLRKDRKKLNVPNATLETRFRSFYTFYLPVTLLAKDKQEFYTYRIEGRDKQKKRPLVSILIFPLDKDSPIASGNALIDEESGAVLKITLDQRSIKGIEKLERKAQSSGARLILTDIHEYDVERDGIRFPSRTSIFERYVTDFKKADTRGAFSYLYGDSYALTRGTNQIELSRTYVNYSSYRFFSISVKVDQEIQ